MHIRWAHSLALLSVALVVLWGASPLGAESDRIVIERWVGTNGHDPVGYCGTAPDRFAVWSDYSYSVIQRIHKDKSGAITDVSYGIKVLGQSVYYGEPSTGITLAGGPGELSHYTYDLERGLLYFSGLSFKVVLPGQGVIYMQSGHYVQDLNSGLIISQSGHNDYNDGNLEALCRALTPQ